MTRAYNVVDADGHVLEPLDLWDHYMDPRFRNRAPRLIKDTDGKERLVIEEQMGNWVLYRMDERGGFIGDTWHGTREDAVWQAKKEFGVEVG